MPWCKLRPVVSEYWATYPEGNVHFFIEADRFCRFLKTKLATGCDLPREVGPVLERESAIVADTLRESLTEATPLEAPLAFKGYPGSYGCDGWIPSIGEHRPLDKRQLLEPAFVRQNIELAGNVVAPDYVEDGIHTAALGELLADRREILGAVVGALAGAVARWSSIQAMSR